MAIAKNLTRKKLQEWAERRATATWTNLLTNHLWQRILKITLATTIAIILASIPAVVRVYGPAAYLAPITTVFGHPGRRFGMMAEALVLALSGTLVGIGWSMLGVYLSSLVVSTNESAAYTVKSIFLAIALLFHGFLRSHTPRLFIFVLLLVIVTVVSLTGRATSISSTLVVILLYPILTAAGILLLVNTLVFPEFSSDFLGITTIETLGETVGALRDAGRYFVTFVEDSSGADKGLEDGESLEEASKSRTAAEKPVEKSTANQISIMQKIFGLLQKSKESDSPAIDKGPKQVELKSLTDDKVRLRAKLASCKAAQQECNFELAWAVLPPRDLKPISDTAMNKLVANTISLIGACESKYALMGDENDKTEDESKDEHHLNQVAKQAKLEDGKKSSRPGTPPAGSHPGTPLDSSHEDSADEMREFKWGRRRPRNKEKRSKSRSKSKNQLEQEKVDLELVKPKKEIEFGDIELLKYLIGHITKPLADLQEKVDRSVDVVTSCLAHCYDVKKLPSGALAPKGIRLEEIDIRVDILTDALADFDRDTSSALEGAAVLHNLNEPQVDVMPRMETFLISSFLLNLRQAALHTLEMLKYSRVIVEKRQARHGRRRLYPPRINWRKWLASGGEEDMFALPEGGRKNARTGAGNDDSKDEDGTSTSKESLLDKKDVESGNRKRFRTPPLKPDAKNVKRKSKKLPSQKGTFIHRIRNGLADSLEYVAGSEDVLYAIKLTVAVFLVTFPAFIYKWNEWFYLNRGLWAALQLILVTEVAIGTSVWTFILRAVGTTLGCLWGYAAYQAGNGNRVICVVILVIGIIPSAYIQLGSKYIKAGMVSIISMSIVALATIDATIPGTPTENFLKRLIAFLIGGIVALVVEVVLFPVRARDRLVESLAASIQQISEMQACLAYGIESETNVNDVRSQAVAQRFDTAKGKAQGALTAAETFLPFCDQEPRLKGSFKGLALIYAEILYVLHAIVDRMDNMLHLRYAYGSGVLEELNAQVYPYRRNVAGSITLILFAVHEALTTKLPLPQFLPSARLSHLRMVNKVREVVVVSGSGGLDDLEDGKGAGKSHIEMTMVKRVVRKKFLAWNAASAGQTEVIEYLEELIDLVKLLVGANEFRSGMLTRPTYREYVDRIDRGVKEMERRDKEQRNDRGETKKDDDAVGGDDGKEGRYSMPEPETNKVELKKRRTTFTRSQDTGPRQKDRTAEEERLERHRRSVEGQLPMSLQRVRSRRLEEMSLQKNRSIDEVSKRREGKRVDKSDR